MGYHVWGVYQRGSQGGVELEGLSQQRIPSFTLSVAVGWRRGELWVVLLVVVVGQDGDHVGAGGTGALGGAEVPRGR